MTDITEQMMISTFTRVCGAFSMLGCGYIMYEVVSSKRKRQGTYFRLMFAMSFFEFCDGLACFLGSWAVPAEPIPWWGTSGTDGSCKFQAFLIQAGVASSLYNAVLAIYYCLRIRYNWSERFITQKVEPWMHGICLILAYGTAIASLFLGIYGSVGLVCMTTRYPPDCKETYKYGYTDCIYGDNSSLYGVLFYEIWLWISILIAAGAMCFVWSAVRNQESRNASYATYSTLAFQNNSNRSIHDNNNNSSNKNNNSSGRQTSARSVVNRKYSRRFGVQGALYVAVFYLCHLFATSAKILYNATGEWNEILLTFAAIVEPLEGFLNFLVYMRPRWIRKWSKRKQQRRNNNNIDNNANSPVSNANSSTVSSERTHFLKSIINFFGRGGREASLADERREANPPTPSNFITAENDDVDSSSDPISSNDRTVQLDEREQMELDAY